MCKNFVHRFRTTCIGTICTFLFVATVNAQTLRNADEPAEYPPNTYTAKQYVDSRGCVFVRAGFGGKTTWVPRVTRSRQQMCGFKPTSASASADGVIPDLIAGSSSNKAGVRRPLKTTVPKSFRSAWTDDRLNSNRGPKTSAGNEQMGLTWTTTIPMQLKVN